MAAVFLAGSLLCGCDRQPAGDLNVILISVDTLRPDYLDCYRPGIETSPQLALFAARSVVFEDVLAQAPSTTISHKSMLYSLYPAVHKTTRIQVPDEGVTSPVEALRRAGFKTAAFVGGGGLAPELGFTKGFETYDVLPPLQSGEQLEALRTRSLHWLDDNHGETFFLFLHMYEPHCPYTPPEPYRERFAGWYQGDVDPTDRCGNYYNKRDMNTDDFAFVQALYSGEAAYVDNYLDDLFAKLEGLGLLENTVVVFTSDHGESLGEQGYVGHNLLFNTQLRVPLIIRVPGLEPRRINAPLESVDIMPTIFAALDQAPPFAFQGHDLLPLMNGAGGGDSTRVRVANQWDGISVNRGPWHLVKLTEAEPPMLFRPENDPQELDDLATRNPMIVEELQREYDLLMKQGADVAEQFAVTSKPLLGEDTIKRLRALGYMH